MKLRVRGNSLRLRLSKGEVSRIGEGGRIEETIQFGRGDEGRLVYALIASHEAENVSARLSRNEILVTVPAKAASEWANSSAISLAAKQAVGSGEELDILVEKDFACLQPRSGEDDSDAFPNPTATC